MQCASLLEQQHARTLRHLHAMYTPLNPTSALALANFSPFSVSFVLFNPRRRVCLPYAAHLSVCVWSFAFGFGFASRLSLMPLSVVRPGLVLLLLPCLVVVQVLAAAPFTVYF